MGSTDRVLAAHLARRAAFGGTPAELDAYCKMNYEDLVEHLITR